MQKQINSIFAGFIIAACLVLAYFLIFTDFKRLELAGPMRTVFIVILLVYAVFRSYRLYKQLTVSEDEK